MTSRSRTAARPAGLVVALAVLATASVLVPILGLVVALPAGQVLDRLLAPTSLQALLLSLRTASISALVCLLLGLPLALVLSRSTLPGRSVLRALVLVPLVLPPVVSGIALLQTVGRHGLLGPLLGAVDIRVVFTTTAVVAAQVFVSLPFTVLTLESSLVALGDREERVAAGLGASPFTVLRRITLPRLLPAIITGGVLAFARSLGEFGATLTVAGSLPGVTRTLPLEIYRVRESDQDSAVTVSVLLLAVALVVVLLAYTGRRGERR